MDQATNIACIHFFLMLVTVTNYFIFQQEEKPPKNDGISTRQWNY